VTRYVVIFRKPNPDRWFKGDHVWRSKVRRVIRGPDPIGGVQSVHLNLVRGLEKIGAPFVSNIAYSEIRSDDRIGVIGLDRYCLDDYNHPNPILAGVAVAAHPMEWPTLFEDKPVARYVVHCDWVKAMYERVYGPRIVTWAVGIDTDHWSPPSSGDRPIDFLVYDKVRWDTERVHRALMDPILAELDRRKLSHSIIRYGAYDRRTFREALHRSKAMLFLCEHETQGLAYQEAMSCGVPILAWDPGMWLDPWRYRYGETHVTATSVPFFDERCGLTFKGVPDFSRQLDAFLDGGSGFAPRDYVVEELSLATSARRYLQLLDDISTEHTSPKPQSQAFTGAV
jgi:Glycosyl transferases group 1